MAVAASAQAAMSSLTPSARAAQARKLRVGYPIAPNIHAFTCVQNAANRHDNQVSHALVCNTMDKRSRVKNLNQDTRYEMHAQDLPQQWQTVFMHMHSQLPSTCMLPKTASLLMTHSEIGLTEAHRLEDSTMCPHRAGSAIPGSACFEPVFGAHRLEDSTMWRAPCWHSHAASASPKPPRPPVST